jgi:hypothetical protein
VEGEWKLLYSTISILGSKRTKLGLRDFIMLGDFIQVIDVKEVHFFVFIIIIIIIRIIIIINISLLRPKLPKFSGTLMKTD